MATVDTDCIGQRRDFLILLIGCLVGCAQPQPGPTASHVVVVADAPAKLSDIDQRFLVAAAGAVHYQRDAARLALQRGTDPIVKSYAAVLNEHHGRAFQELREIVQARNLASPEGVPAERRNALEALAALPAETFDRRFIEVGIADQQVDLEMFELASRSVNDLALRAWAQRMVPVLQQHLVSARSLPVRLAAVA